jgi:hypothetical protein
MATSAFLPLRRRRRRTRLFKTTESKDKPYRNILLAPILDFVSLPHVTCN